MLEKLKFWKKDDDFDFDKAVDFHDPALETHPDPLNPESSFPEEHPTLARPSQFSPAKDRDLELINSKLDTLKAMLTSLDQRLANVEQAVGSKKEPRLW